MCLTGGDIPADLITSDSPSGSDSPVTSSAGSDIIVPETEAQLQKVKPVSTTNVNIGSTVKLLCKLLCKLQRHYEVFLAAFSDDFVSVYHLNLITF